MLITQTDISKLESFFKTKTTEAFAKHSLTNKLTNTLRFEADSDENKAELRMYGKKYGIYLDRGVKAKDIPYSRGSGAGHSDYIEGLTKYGNLRLGLTGRDALSFAFAVANKQKKVGMPISTKGNGTAWFSDMIKNLQIEKELIPVVKKKVQIKLHNQIKKT